MARLSLRFDMVAGEFRPGSWTGPKQQGMKAFALALVATSSRGFWEAGSHCSRKAWIMA